MSEKTVTIWTCDRCDAKVETGHGEQPTRWAGVTVVHPPRASRESDRARTVHLCVECDSDLVAFIDYPRPASAVSGRIAPESTPDPAGSAGTENHADGSMS